MVPCERRQTPRLDVLDELHGRLVAVRVPLTVRELGPGGFSIESVVPFPSGSRHQFRFTTTEDDAIIVEAVAVHSRYLAMEGGVRQYVSGFAFCHLEPETADGVYRLLQALTSSLQFR
jgi:hypothetical protein